MWQLLRDVLQHKSALEVCGTVEAAAAAGIYGRLLEAGHAWRRTWYAVFDSSEGIRGTWLAGSVAGQR